MGNSIANPKTKYGEGRNIKISWEDDPDEEEYFAENIRPSQHLKSATLRSNIMRVQKDRDPLLYYEIVSVLGVGSMGTVSKVRKKEQAVGGSAREANVQQSSRKKCFDLPLIGSVLQFLSTRSDISLLEDESSLSRSERLTTIYESTRSRDSIRSSSHSRCYEVFYALKSIHLNRVTDPSFVNELKNEIEILKKLDHPHIVRPIETYEHRNQLYVVMELCSGGDLYARDPYTETEAARIISCILSAVNYMHEHDICHRDIKYENVLFVNEKPMAEIKMIDFGLSKRYASKSPTMSEGVGTIYTMAPEVLKGSYTYQADVWSVGVLAYMLLSSQMPFFGRKRRHIVEQIMKCKYNFEGRRWKSVSAQAKSFVSSLLVLDPQERATAAEASRSTWLNRRYAATVRSPHQEEMEAIQSSFKRFSDYTKMKRLALMVIAHKSTAEEIGILRKAFQEYDTQRRGMISFPEFKGALEKYGYTDVEIENMFDSVDLDGSGKIRYTEFLAATIEGHGTITEERLAEAFDRLDSDDSGYISARDLRDILGDDLPQVDIDDVLNEVEHSSDNRISYHEFLACFEDRTAEKKEELLLAIDQSAHTSFNDVSSHASESSAPSEKTQRKILARDTNTLARANFLEEKKISERRHSLSEKSTMLTSPNLDPMVTAVS